jgi:c-di-GMP-binding flagellar brake protein YcgR
MSVEDKQPNRRAAERMDIEREVQYRVLDNKNPDPSAHGKTVNMSSSGVLFTTEKALPSGRRVELNINWPAQLDNKCALKLVARGRIVRSQADSAAIEILQHEFRTKGRG